MPGRRFCSGLSQVWRLPVGIEGMGTAARSNGAEQEGRRSTGI